MLHHVNPKQGDPKPGRPKQGIALRAHFSAILRLPGISALIHPKCFRANTEL
jgi:hypothetical protein